MGKGQGRVWRPGTTQPQDLLQSSNQRSVGKGQKQNRQSRNKPTHVEIMDFWQSIKIIRERIIFITEQC